jgi:hypothetical protein
VLVLDALANAILELNIQFQILYFVSECSVAKDPADRNRFAIFCCEISFRLPQDGLDWERNGCHQEKD